VNEIWLGPLLNDNRALLIERCAKFLANNQSDAFIFLAASYPLLERVTQELLDGQHRDPDHGSPEGLCYETTRGGQPNRAAHAWNDGAQPFRAALVTPGHVASLQCS